MTDARLIPSADAGAGRSDSVSVVVTNDDGMLSPLLHHFLRALSSEPWCRELRPVIPKDEQSWVAQSITRFRHLNVQRQNLFDGVDAMVVDGSPADCASLGITELYSGRPDLLVSGINLGTNESLAFYLNSGTVGGARQGMVFGCPAIALSLKLPGPLFNKWRELDLEGLAEHAADWERVSRVACRVVERLLDPALWEGVDLYTVNFPWEATLNTEVKVCRLERVTYPSIFHPFADGVFRHRLDELIPSDNEPPPPGIWGDREALDSGAIALTPIHYDLLPKDEALLAKLRDAFAS